MFAGSLRGIRVLDLTRVLAGPFGGALLADLGAEVIKIEDRESGDPTRAMGPAAHGTTAYFTATNRDKRSVTLDLRQPEGQTVFHDLVRVSDVVLDNFRPGVLAKLGADYETLREVKPDIICCSITGYGQDGPYADLPAFDLAIQALAGGMSVTGEPGRPPLRMGFSVADLGGGMFAATAVCAALVHRARTGEGQRLDVPLLDTHVAMLTYLGQYWLSCGEVTEPVGSEHPSLAPYGAFATRDGYIVLAVIGEKFWHLLCDRLDDDALRTNPRFALNAERAKHRDALRAALEDHFKERPTVEWVTMLREAGVPCAPVNDIAHAFADPQVVHRRLVRKLDTPAGPVPVVAGPFTTAGGRTADPAAPPRLGQDTDRILRDLLGYDSARVERLRGQEVI